MLLSKRSLLREEQKTGKIKEIKWSVFFAWGLFLPPWSPKAFRNHSFHILKNGFTEFEPKDKLDILPFFVYNSTGKAMKKAGLFFLLLIGCLGLTAANNVPDFTAADIITQKDNFIYIKLQNLSPHSVQVTPQQKEKIFLILFINNIKRAEYKLKYMDKKLFTPKGVILFRTNFRLQKGMDLKVKTQVNPLKVIPETNFLNNTREKRLKSGS